MAKAKSTKASKEVKITIPAANTAWGTFVAKTQKIDETSQIAVLSFAKTIASRKIKLRSARLSIENLGTKSKVMHTSQIEALPTLIELIEKSKKVKGFATFANMDIKEKLTKATAAYKLGVGVAVQMATWEAVQKEITSYNARKNAGSPKPDNSKPDNSKPKKVVSVEDTLKATIALVNGLEDGMEESVYDLLLELAKVTALKVGVDA